MVRTDRSSEENRRRAPRRYAVVAVAAVFAAGATGAAGLRVVMLPSSLGGAQRARVQQFEVSGTLRAPLYPGVSQRLNLVFRNPHRVPIRVTSVRITVDNRTSKSRCAGRANLRVRRTLRGAVTVPARAKRSLSRLRVRRSRWPLLTMPNLNTNQDACQRAAFRLRYRGRARKLEAQRR